MDEANEEPLECLSATKEDSNSPPDTSVIDECDVFDAEKTSLVSVVYIESEIETWVTDFDKLDDVKSVMDSLASLQTTALEAPALDDICAAKDQTDGKWYRAKILAMEPSILVRFIDFGNQSEISAQNLACLPDELKVDPPLAKRVYLNWECYKLDQASPVVGDILEVKYDGKEANGAVKLEVLSVSKIPEADETFSDEDHLCPSRETAEFHVLKGGVDDSTTDQARFNAENLIQQHDPFVSPKNGNELETEHSGDLHLEEGLTFSAELVTVDQDVNEPSVQDLLKELDKCLPNQDEVALEARLEVQKAMNEMDKRSLVNTEVAAEVAEQARREVQKIMETLDERMQKRQEAALSSIRKMVEKTLSHSLSKIDKIQRDVHKLCENTNLANSKQHQQLRRETPMQGSSNVDQGNRYDEQAFHRNQYNRPGPRNAQDFDSTRSPKFDGFGAKFNEQSLSSVLSMRQPSTGITPAKDYTNLYRVGTDHNATRNFNVSFGQASTDDSNKKMPSPEKKSVSLRLTQARGGMEAKFNNNTSSATSGVTSNTILSISNLPEAFSLEYVCTLFGLYGNILRAKILFQQKGKALVEMADHEQAAACVSNLDNTHLMGHNIHVRPSTFDKLNITPVELTNGTAKDNTRLNSYQLKSVRRFKPGYWDASRLVAPSDTLRVNNILKTVPDEDVKKAFTNKGFEFKSMYFAQGNADKKTAFVTFFSVDDAFKALHEMHNFELTDWMPLKIGFGINKRGDDARKE